MKVLPVPTGPMIRALNAGKGTARARAMPFLARDTVNTVLDAYLATAGFEKEADTRASYKLAVLPVRDMYGPREARTITRADAEKLRDHMLTAGRKRGGVVGSGLSARSVRLTLGRWSAAMEQAVDDGKISANPVRKVTLPRQVKPQHKTWGSDQVRAYLAQAGQDRLGACWVLSLRGLRRQEVCGLRWSDVDLASPARTAR